jgi:hypothetical protein
MKMLYRILAALFLSIAVVQAQQTGITGHVNDASGAVISNAAVDVKEVGGATYSTKTNVFGVYLIPTLTAGDYSVTISAPGFSTVQTKVSMLIGQTPNVDVILPVRGTSDAVIVRADETAVDTTSSTVAGNITPDDVKNLPINGRNYMELATLVPGVRVNAIVNDTPLGGANSGKFQINLDGLQVTQNTADASFGQPRFSPDAISQFQIITNRFDATLGRSAGVAVNVQSKTGTNQIHGSAFGYFRNSAFNAGDPILKAQGNPTPITPLSDQQYGGTVGGPIRKEKLWYFGSYEGEHQSSSVTDTPLLPGSVSSAIPQLLRVNEYLGRVDFQANGKNHIFVRGNGFTFKNDHTFSSGSADLSSAYYATRSNYTIMGDWNHVVSSRMVNDVHADFSHFSWQNLPLYVSQAITFGTVTVGAPYNYPQIFNQNVQEYRDDLYYLTGKHSLKFGGEYLYSSNTGLFQQNLNGTASSCASIVAKTVNGITYTPAQVAADLFPQGTLSASTWNYTNTANPTQSSINSLCALGTFTQGSGNFNVAIPRSQIAFWAQDDYKVLARLTLNLGLRYDNDLGIFNTGLKLNNGLLTPTSNDNHEFAPRVGFVYDLSGSGRTVIRGGAGMFFADIAANQTIDSQIFNGVTSLQQSITGSSSSPLNLLKPFANPTATPRQAVQPLGPNVSTPYGLQMSIGVQRELPMRSSITADYVHTRLYHDWVRLNSNLLQNTANPQFNLNPSSKYVAGTTVSCPTGGVTPDPVQGAFNACAQAFTAVNQFFTPNGAGSIYDALQLGVRHNLDHGFTGGVAYTYARLKDSSESPFYYPNKPFINGLHDEWANGQDDQRHTLTVTGDYAWKYGLSLSTLFHYGSGNAFPTTAGTTQPTGYAPSYNRTFGAGITPIAPGTTCPTTPASSCVTVYNPIANDYFDTATGYWMVKRDSLYGRDIYRVDTRLQEAHKIGDRFRAVVAVEGFNLFNHSNYGTYNGIANNALYGTPQATTSSATGIPVEWRPRSLQFLGRFEF